MLREAVRGWEKVAATSEGFAFVAILYTGAVGNKCGLSKVLRKALFVGIMNSFDKGYNPLVCCSTLCRVDYILRTIGAWGGDLVCQQRLSSEG